MRLPWKTELPRYFSLYLNMYFLSFRIFKQLALALKSKVAQTFFAVWNILFTFWIWATCACPEKQSCPEIFRCMEYSFYIQNFWATCACPEKQSCPDIFHCIEHVFFIIQEFWVTCACPEKQRVPWNFSLYWMYFLHSGVLSNLHALALKNRGCPDIFHCMEYTFYIQEFWATCMRLPWKTEGALIFFIVFNMYFLSIRIFEQLALALKNRVAQKFFAVWNILLHSEFLNNLLLPWKTEGALNLLYCMYIFYYSEFLSNLRLPWKTELHWNFHCTEIYFIIQDFWATCACPEIFQARGDARPPASYAYVHVHGCWSLLLTVWHGRRSWFCFWRILRHTDLSCVTELVGFELLALPSTALYFDWRWITNNPKHLKMKHV